MDQTSLKRLFNEATAEIDRLRAELAAAQATRTEQQWAADVRMWQQDRDALAFMQGHGIVEENKSLRAELAEARRALLAGNDTVLANKRLQADNAALKARIAELEAAGNRLGDAAITGILDGNDFRSRAEKAEAERDQAVQELEEMDAIHSRAQKAEAERDALREALSFYRENTDHGMRARAALGPSPAGEKS